MGIIRQRIQEQVGQAVPRQMIGQIAARREYQPAGIDAARRRLRGSAAAVSGLQEISHSTLPGAGPAAASRYRTPAR